MAWHVHRQAFFIQSKTLCPQRHALIETDMISDHSRLPDHNACSMIYTEIFSYLRSRMNVYSCIRMGHFRYNTWNHRHTELQ